MDAYLTLMNGTEVIVLPKTEIVSVNDYVVVFEVHKMDSSDLNKITSWKKIGVTFLSDRIHICADRSYVKRLIF